MIISRPIKALHRIREFIAADPTTETARRVQQDQHTFLPFEERISSKVCELVSNVVGRWQGQQVPFISTGIMHCVFYLHGMVDWEMRNLIEMLLNYSRALY